jgi:hypothetical protein
VITAIHPTPVAVIAAGDQCGGSGAATVRRFTFGEGAAGLHREGYYAGWEMVGGMMGRLRMSLHDIATTAPERYPTLVNQAIDAILASTPPQGLCS